MLAAETRRKCIVRFANEPTQDGLIGVVAPVSRSEETAE
jgi:hypothetical protein